MVYRVKIDKEKDRWIGKGFDSYAYTGKYAPKPYGLAISFETYEDAVSAVEWCKSRKKINDYYEIIMI